MRNWKIRRGLPSESDLEKDPYGLYEGVDYKQFWTGLQKSKLDELEHAIMRDLLPISGRRIIDVGCGYGRLADCYMGRFQQVVMVDGSMSLLRQALEKTRGQAIYIASGVTNLPFRTACFDSAVMIRVLHHIKDSQTCLSELHRVLCSDGRFIFSYCNKRNALRVVKWLVRKNTENPFTAEPAGVGSTLISHHPRSVHRMLLETNCADIRYYGVGVMDVLAGRLGSMGRWIPPGKRLAGLFGSSKIAPWIFCGAIARGNTRLINARRIADLLQCPACGGRVSDDTQEYLCLTCNRRYPVEDGIIDLRL